MLKNKEECDEAPILSSNNHEKLCESMPSVVYRRGAAAVELIKSQESLLCSGSQETDRC